jgi:hypothetical protein
MTTNEVEAVIGDLPVRQHQWLMTIILATWKTDIWRIMARGQPGQKVSLTPSQSITGWVAHACHPKAVRD